MRDGCQSEPVEDMRANALMFIWAFPLISGCAFRSYCTGLSHGPVSLPAGRQALQSLMHPTRHVIARNEQGCVSGMTWQSPIIQILESIVD
jgi:hypothetical protein